MSSCMAAVISVPKFGKRCMSNDATENPVALQQPSPLIADDLDESEGDELLLDLCASDATEPTPRIFSASSEVAHAAHIDGMRVDGALAKLFPTLSRSKIQSYIDDGRVLLAGKPIKKSSEKIKFPAVPASAQPSRSTATNLDSFIVVTLPEPVITTLLPEDIPLDLVFEDEHLLVVNKPAGLVVHPGAGHHSGTLLNALLAKCPDLQKSTLPRPGLIHRLDKDTSGLLVCAKTEEAQFHIAKQFQNRTVQKKYLAFCLGVPAPFVHCKTGHKRADTDRRRFTSKISATLAGQNGVRIAITDFRTVASQAGVAAVQAYLHTGRTHQIRIHLADLGYPLLQDALYGGSNIDKRLSPKNTPVYLRQAVVQLQRQALHAFSLTLHHPTTGQEIRCIAPLPPDLLAVAHALMPAATPEERAVLWDETWQRLQESPHTT